MLPPSPCPNVALLVKALSGIISSRLSPSPCPNVAVLDKALLGISIPYYPTLSQCGPPCEGTLGDDYHTMLSPLSPQCYPPLILAHHLAESHYIGGKYGC